MKAAERQSERPGLFESIKKLGATAIALTYTRLEILATELEEEKLRVVQLLLITAVTFLCFTLGAALLILFLVILFWETHKIIVLGILAALFLILGVILLYVLRRKATKPKLFSSSLSELAKDHEQLIS